MLTRTPLGISVMGPSSTPRNESIPNEAVNFIGMEETPNTYKGAQVLAHKHVGITDDPLVTRAKTVDEFPGFQAESLAPLPTTVFKPTLGSHAEFLALAPTSGFQAHSRLSSPLRSQAK